jgi:hypothetical protein
MYNRICEENGPADPVLQGIVSRWRVASRLWWDLIERSGGLQWLLITYAHTYATVILISIGEGCQPASDTMAAIIEKTESEEQAALYQEAEGLNDIISKRGAL